MDGAIFDITDRREAEQNARRREIEEARKEELRASRARVVEAADAARRKIERDLHDGAQQRLVALGLNVRLARSRIDAEPESAGPFLDTLLEELTAASTELRELARGIHPAVLTDRGLAPAVAALAARAPVPVEIVELPDDRAPTAAEAAAYFTVAEALTNVAKYACATQATVRVAKEDGALVVEVRDDGVGGARASAGSGLAGLADRVDAVDGSLSVISPPGRARSCAPSCRCGSRAADGNLARMRLPSTTMVRFDHVGVVVDDLDAVAAFFVGLGFERDGGMLVEGEAVDKINGLDGVRADIVMVRTPDGSGTLELVKYRTPADTGGAQPLPANRLGFRHICYRGRWPQHDRRRIARPELRDGRRGL